TASPAFMQRHCPDGVTAEALEHAPCLTFNAKDRLQAQWLRRAGMEGAVPTHWLPSSQAFIDAALAGVGWGMNPLPLAVAHLAAGRLVEVLPGQGLDVPLFWQRSRMPSANLSRLTKAVQRAAAGVLIP
ncbi:MAG: ArgP/LysG family DNA-binding transcriptional regulator, partial [Niveispirillum sp.]|nr:ArgP/LysG family DNA-binding transcriptional regulator [Niveispirillum sp.]